MVRGVPDLFAFVPFEHGKVCDPEKSEILGGVAGFLEDAVAVCVFLGQCQAQQAGGGVDCLLLGVTLLWAAMAVCGPAWAEPATSTIKSPSSMLTFFAIAAAPSGICWRCV